jgi:hypothetical protein
MGTRAQVLIKETGIYLYQHSDGYDLFETVKESLKRVEKAGRLTDVEYMTRMVFCDMIKKCEDYKSAEVSKKYGFSGELGFGIGKERHGDIEYLVTIDKKGKATQKKF